MLLGDIYIADIQQIHMVTGKSIHLNISKDVHVDGAKATVHDNNHGTDLVTDYMTTFM